MSQKANYEKMRAMGEKLDSMELAAVGQSDKIRNTDGRRKKLLDFMHCLHILRLDGSIPVNDDHEVMAGEELKAKISRCTDRAKMRRESIQLTVINDHTHTWYIARHYYEKCSKLLCQMMVTVMDFMLEAETGRSVLYTPEEKKENVSMESELAILSRGFRNSYYYMCAYDYCTGRLAEYVGTEEYGLLMPEHRRIVSNGLPARLVRIADAYCKLKNCPDIITDKAVKDPESLYDEKLLARIYDEIIKGYEDIDAAMHDYHNLVSAVDYAYCAEFRKRQGA